MTIALFLLSEYAHAEDSSVGAEADSNSQYQRLIDFVKSSKSAMSIEWQLEFDYSQDFNYDIDAELDYEYSLEPTLEMEVEYEVSDALQLFLGLEYGREWEDGNQGTDREYESTFELKEAFMELSDLMGSDFALEDVTFTLGRRGVSDSREWFYDADVDGLIIEANVPSLDSEVLLSINREEWIGSDLLRHNEPDKVSNLILALEYQHFKNVDVGVHAIIRNDSSSDNDSPRFFGLSANGEILDKRINFWADAAVARGKDGGDSIKGKGFDIGSTFALSPTAGPYLTLGYAHGSGDGDKDTDFRQTGLHGNSDRFAGITSFNYYGELLDPELSNLEILTAGIGVRPTNKLSIDLNYHWYDQNVALDELRDSNLDMDPNGLSKDIGTGVDLIAGFTSRNNINTEMVIGYFKPGAAFDDASEALLLSASVGFKF